MAISTLYISTQNYRWDDKIPLIDSKNFTNIICSDFKSDYRTSMGDVKSDNLHLIVSNAEKITLINPEDLLDDPHTYTTGRLFKVLIRFKDKVTNLDIINTINYKNLLIERNSDSPILWISGCSVTYGAGVKIQERFSNLLSNKLNMPLINLAESGRSIFWTVDSLMRADIKANDIVVLGLTNVARYEYTDGWQLLAKPAHYTDRLEHIEVDYFESRTHILKCSRHILHLINFCNKIKAKIIIANLLDCTWMPIIFNGHPNFIDLSSFTPSSVEYIDLGYDNTHPGPLQHQEYAEKLFNFIQQLND